MEVLKSFSSSLHHSSTPTLQLSKKWSFFTKADVDGDVDGTGVFDWSDTLDVSVAMRDNTTVYTIKKNKNPKNRFMVPPHINNIACWKMIMVKNDSTLPFFLSGWFIKVFERLTFIDFNFQRTKKDRQDYRMYRISSSYPVHPVHPVYLFHMSYSSSPLVTVVKQIPAEIPLVWRYSTTILRFRSMTKIPASPPAVEGFDT